MSAKKEKKKEFFFINIFVILFFLFNHILGATHCQFNYELHIHK